jgi:DNA-binding PucR family transcriptional regulator
VPHLDAVQHSRWEADRVLEVLADSGPDRSVATFDEVRSSVMLLELGEEIRRNPRLRCGVVQRIVEYDAAHGTAYVETLRAHLEALGNVATASARLHVHPSTFRYRLRRLVELFGLDLQNPVERLAAELELHLL